MATTTLSVNPQRITVPANTTEHDINFDNLLTDNSGEALVDWVSGTAIQLSCNGVAITSDSATLATGNNKFFLPITKGVNIRYKGGAGSEVFQITILSQ